MKKRLFLTLVLVGLLAFGVGMGTFAWFTSTATSTDNVFETGTLDIMGPGESGIVADMAVGNIYPSWTSGAKTITVTNSGSLDFKYRISVEALTENILYDGDTPLQVSVNDGDFVDIDEMGYVELGDIDAGQTGTFTIEFKLPQEADNDYQDADATFSFVFDATQIGNTGWTE